MLENLVIAYHLSHSEMPTSDAHGHFKVLDAEHVFNHWQPGQTYLHQVSYSQGAITEHCEDGHHDGVSSFSFDEFVVVDDLSSQQYWLLNNRESLFSLLKSEFITALSASIFSSQDSLHRTVLEIVDVELAIEYIRHAQLSVQTLRHCLTGEHVNLMKEMLICGLFKESDFCNCTLSHINWKKLTKDKDDFMGETIESKLGLNSQFELLLGNLYGDTFTPKTESLSATLVAIALINALPWQSYMTTGKKIMLPCGLILMLLRLNQAHNLGAIFTHVDIELEFTDAENSIDKLIDRLVVYQHLELLKLLQNKFDKQQSLRCASSQLATDSSKWKITDFSIADNQEVLNWQLQHDQWSLKQAASCGYLFLCEQLLAKETASSADLDSALLSAAELGYCEIVKLLHKYGASLDAGGRWPIRYANKFAYKTLKKYLLEQGQDDLYF